MTDRSQYYKEYESRPEVKERRARTWKIWYQKNIELQKEKSKIYYYDNKERYAKYNKKWRAENREKRANYLKQYNKKWIENNPNKYLKQCIRRLEKYALPYKLPTRQYEYAIIAWSKLIKKIHGNVCAICGSSNNINSHHIFHKAKYPGLSLNPNNGIPLCRIHHNEAHFWRPFR